MKKILLLMTVFLTFYAGKTYCQDSSLKIYIEKPDIYGRLMDDKTWTIYLDGEIDDKSYEAILEALDNVPSDQLAFALNSPGGNLYEGMEIGRLIRRHGYKTLVATSPQSPFYGQKSSCMSACALAFLGGAYRYVNADSYLGVHRFSKDYFDLNDFENAQIISADINNYLSEMGVSPKFFDLSTKASANEIYILSQHELKKYQIANYSRQEASWDLEIIDDLIYLRGMQITLYGTGKLLFYCADGGLKLHSIYEAEDFAEEIIKTTNVHSLLLEGKPYKLTKPDAFINDNGWVNALHSVPQDMYQKISVSNEIGYAMQVSEQSPLFKGFRIEVPTEQNKKKVSSFINKCM